MIYVLLDISVYPPRSEDAERAGASVSELRQRFAGNPPPANAIKRIYVHATQVEERREMETEEKKEAARGGEEDEPPHVLVLPYPVQGHISPMLQFAKRLQAHGLKVTLATTRFLAKHTAPGPIEIVTISDGFDEGGYLAAPDPETYHTRLEMVGSQTLGEMMEERPFSCLVYDTSLPWAVDVAEKMGVLGVAFSTQSAAVFAVYYYVGRGMMAAPAEGSTVAMPGLPPLGAGDLPSFVSDGGAYQSVKVLKLAQFSNLDKPYCLLFNTVNELEDEAVRCLGQIWRVKTVGPSLPSMYLDQCIEGDNDYGFSYWKADGLACMEWLDSRETGSVVYMSFGSIATLGSDQMEEFAWGLRETDYKFLWVVRASEAEKLPSKFKDEVLADGKGLILTWVPQLEVLAHRSMGCFVTHCGWNSILEALSLGVPMVGVPQWTDQPTNAKYVEDVWGVGLRAKVDGKGIVGRHEIGKCVKEVMEGEKAEGIRRNARKYKEWIKAAVTDHGSSYKNIKEIMELVSSKVGIK
ncbi:hypothetical protein ACLOJK_008909 [Asimina triloba]